MGGKRRNAVIGTNNFDNFPADPLNRNSCAHAVRDQPVAGPLFQKFVHLSREAGAVLLRALQDIAEIYRRYN